MSYSANDAWLNEAVARAVSQTDEFAGVAEDLAEAVRAEAAEDAASGGFARSVETKAIRTRTGVRDFLVYSTHPAALSIEYGHWAGDKEAGTGRFVPGTHAFTKAVKKLRKG